eukprot:Nk52_evm4s330 gene=Nk52_evmTU4s330
MSVLYKRNITMKLLSSTLLGLGGMNMKRIGAVRHHCSVRGVQSRLQSVRSKGWTGRQSVGGSTRRCLSSEVNQERQNGQSSDVCGLKPAFTMKTEKGSSAEFASCAALLEEENCVWVVDYAGNKIIKFAGDKREVADVFGSGARGAKDAVGNEIQFDGPCEIAILSSKNKLYLTDSNNYRIASVNLETGQSESLLPRRHAVHKEWSSMWKNRIWDMTRGVYRLIIDFRYQLKPFILNTNELYYRYSSDYRLKANCASVDEASSWKPVHIALDEDGNRLVIASEDYSQGCRLSLSGWFPRIEAWRGGSFESLTQVEIEGRKYFEVRETTSEGKRLLKDMMDTLRLSSSDVQYGPGFAPDKFCKTERLPMSRGRARLDPLSATVARKDYCELENCVSFASDLLVLGPGDGCIDVEIPAPEGYRFYEPVVGFFYDVEGSIVNPFGVPDFKYEGQPSLHLATGDHFQEHLLEGHLGRSDVTEVFKVRNPVCKSDLMSFPVQIISSTGSGYINADFALACKSLDASDSRIFKLDVRVNIPLRILQAAPLQAKISLTTDIFKKAQ